MTLFGAQGIRDSLAKTYQKHLRLFQNTPPENNLPLHHSALHGSLALRYAASYRGIPDNVVWLEVAPFLTLPSEQSVRALAEYVVFKERPRKANREFLERSIQRGLELMSAEDRELFVVTAREYGFSWLAFTNTTHHE
jgi:hypothetical protein